MPFIGLIYFIVIYIIPSIIKYYLLKYDLLKYNSSYDDFNNICVSIIIPCRNEEKVILNTLKSISMVKYDKVEVLIVDDGSIDSSYDIINNYIIQLDNMNILRIPYSESGKGKSTALNKGFEYLDKITKFDKSNNHIVCILDADGNIEKDCMEKVSNYFANSKMGALNSSIKIKNTDTTIAYLQYIEFYIMARYINFIRGYAWNNAFMGGNGQYMRYTVLMELYDEDGYIWKDYALTEDLDIGIRINKNGWYTKQMFDVFVYQQGIDDFIKLYKQRIRWAWGNMQTNIIKVFMKDITKNKMDMISKIDTGIALSIGVVYITLSILCPLSILLCYMNIIGNAHVKIFKLLLLNSCTWMIYILACVVLDILVNLKIDIKLILHIPLFITYTLLLSSTMIIGIINVIIKKKPVWYKTERSNESN